MKYLEKYTQYIKEAITTDVDELLNSINDKKVDFFTLGLSNDDYINKSIDELYDDANFNKEMFKNNLKKGEIDYTEDIENFLKKNIDMKFFFLYSRSETVLDNPDYLILQYNKNEKWSSVKIYKIKGSVDDFYDKLTAKMIKLTYDDTVYIYQTSNSGNNWDLRDVDKETDKFKDSLETSEIKKLVEDGTKLTIIN